MKIKTFKNGFIYNDAKLIKKLESRGYIVLRNEDGYSLFFSTFKKVFSTWGLIFIVKEVKLIAQNQKIEAHLVFNFFALAVLYFCAFSACAVMIYREPSLDLIKIFLTFLFLLVVASLAIFAVLRSDILKDFKETIR